MKILKKQKLKNLYTSENIPTKEAKINKNNHVIFFITKPIIFTITKV